MTVLKFAVNGYFWIAAIGFPIILMHWLDYERRVSKHDWRVGYDDGYEAATDLAEKMQRSLFPRIEHGDAEHRRWLKNAIYSHFELEREQTGEVSSHE